MLDLRKLNSVNFDKTASTATGGAGVQLIDIYSALASHGVTVPGYYGNGVTSAWTSQAHTKIQPFVSGRAYQNYIDPTLAHWEQAYYDQNLSRLKATRQRVDPDHYFNFPQAIGR